MYHIYEAFNKKDLKISKSRNEIVELFIVVFHEPKEPVFINLTNIFESIADNNGVLPPIT